MRRSLVIAFVAILGLAGVASAQSGSTGAIAGVARDATGGVLPGVTVEVASPALIEKVRTAVTDGDGNYRIVELRPGTYTVTFTLTGFASFRREGLELNAGVTAAINAEMRVGGLEESVTVTGASPVVDVQNVRKQQLLTREVIDILPTGRTVQGFAALTLGARGTGADGAASATDVGGSKGEGNSGFGVHGMRGEDSIITQDGMFSNSIIGNGSTQNRQTQVNQAFVQEMVLQISGVGAESQTGGVQINIVPREGGNQFKLYSFNSGTSGRFQVENLDDELRARGVTTAPKVKRVWDISAGVGGPIRRDKLWFYSAQRYWGNEEIVPGNYFNATQGTFRYTPDLKRPAFVRRTNGDVSVRLTWQVTGKDKLALNFSDQHICNCTNTVNGNIPTAPEASINGPNVHARLTQVTWNRPATTRLLLEGGYTFSKNPQVVLRQEGVEISTPPIIELTTNLRYNAWTQGVSPGRSYTTSEIPQYTDQSNQRVTVSCITGAHALKVGFSMMQGWQATGLRLNEVPGVGPVAYSLRNGVPASLTQYASPFYGGRSQMRDHALFAQDQWTIHRLTATAGVRYDRHRAWADAAETPVMAFVGSASFPRVDNVPNWRDVSPRIGATYDLFGNAKTALKASVGRYTQLETVTIADANAPVRRLANNVTRTWTDANGNLRPDCDLNNRLQNGECGQVNNLAFGTLAAATSFDPELLSGYKVRPYTWQAMTSVQHELRPGVALNAGYFRAWYGNFTVVDNLRTAPADFDPYCITAPTDARLGSVSGKQICGLYDVNPSRFGQVSNLNTFTANFGERTQVYNGFEASISARFGKGGLFQAGTSSGRTVSDNCVVVDSPQAARPGYCKEVLPFKGQTQVKLSGVYPLPYDISLSGTFQYVAGIPLAADLPVPSAQILPSLGRNLSAGAAALATVPLMVPNEQFEKSLNQLDLRATKTVRFAGRGRVQVMFDVYNILNVNTVFAMNTTYGPSWLRPTAVLGGRLLKFGGQFDW